MTDYAGHGHVRPHPAGIKARCGGPAFCGECGIEWRNLADAVRELYWWQAHGPNATNFSAILYTLIQKGSHGNRERLGRVFPWELEAWRQWQAAPDADDFFGKFGFGRKATV